MVQFARPVADLVTHTAWTATPYWSKVDEGAPGDAVVIQNAEPTETSEIIALDGSTVTDPAVSTGHVIRANFQKVSGGGTLRLTVQLRQGYVNESTLGTLIATGLFDESDIGIFVTYTYTLTGTEADAITDYANLQFRVWASKDDGTGGRPIDVDFLELEVPDAAGGVSGGSTAIVTVLAEGAGTKAGSGGDTSVVLVLAEGAGSKAASGGSTAVVVVTAEGGGVKIIFAPGQALAWLGGQIDVRVEIDTGEAGSLFGLWGEGTWGESTWGSDDPAWTDISEFTEDINTDQGTERWGGRFETGSMFILLDNTDGRFTPDSGFDPFHLPFRPGRRIRIVAIPNPTLLGDKKPLWTGFIDSLTPTFDEGGFLLTVQLNCLDFMARWGGHDPVALVAATGVQGTHTRVGAALDRMDWPVGDRDVQTGVHTMQTSHLAQTTLEECGTAADAEGGHFFCSPDGKATFKARDWLSTDARSIEVQGYLGFDEFPDGANTAFVEAASISPSWENARIINQVEFARVGSTMQTVNDATSQALYDIKSYQITDLQNNTDAEVLFLAQRYLDAFKDSKMRLESITISALADPDNQDRNRLMWDTKFGDLILVKVPTPYGWFLERLVKVMGISHHITAEDWTVTFKLDDIFIFVGGADLLLNLSFEGGGTNPAREGGAEMAIGVTFEGGGTAANKTGGADLLISLSFEGGGNAHHRESIMGLLAPVAWWQMTFPATADSSGNGHTLSWSGDVVSTATGGPIPGDDGLVTFGGVDGFATVALEDALELRQDMSIEMWVRPHDASGGSQAMLSCRASADPLYEVFYRPDLDDIAFFPTSSAGAAVSYIDGTIPVNEWRHIVITIDWIGSDRAIKLYLSGSLRLSNTFAYQPGVIDRVINIGRRAIANDLYFDGDISELTIFDYVLTDEQVALLFESNYEE